MVTSAMKPGTGCLPITIVVLLTWAESTTANRADATRRPNVVLIMTDDE